MASAENAAGPATMPLAGLQSYHSLISPHTRWVPRVFNVLRTVCVLNYTHDSSMFHCSPSPKAIVLVKRLEFVGDGVNRGVDLCSVVVGCDEKSQAG